MHALRPSIFILKSIPFFWWAAKQGLLNDGKVIVQGSRRGREAERAALKSVS